jgi:S1-C subfamily serine protease
MKVNGEKIDDYANFVRDVTRTKPGERLTFEIKRNDKAISVIVLVEARRHRR